MWSEASGHYETNCQNVEVNSSNRLTMTPTPAENVIAGNIINVPGYSSSTPWKVDDIHYRGNKIKMRGTGIV